jgi:multiple antibiotic resistance protein
MVEFGSAFVFILMAVDPFGMVPIFLSLTEEMGVAEKRRAIAQSIVTALCVAVAFIFVGKALFRAIGVTMSDFMIAGGVLLFIIAVTDLMTGEKRRYKPTESLGVVPLGTPLIVGPAVLTAGLMLRDVYGLVPTVLATVANIALVGVVLLGSDSFVRIVGQAGTRALSKVSLVLLAAFAVMMVRKGIVAALGSNA